MHYTCPNPVLQCNKKRMPRRVPGKGDKQPW